MKMASWNINSVRLRMPLLAEFVMQEMPDIILLQETKTQDQFFPIEAMHAIGYQHIYMQGQKSYNGVAILSKIPFDDTWSYSLCNDDARHVAARINGIDVHNFYVPAGGDEPDININPKFAHKLRYLNEMKDLFLDRKAENVVIAGDFNIAPYEHDVWSSRQLRNTVSHTEIERNLLLDLCKSGDFIDIARHFIPLDKKLYSWWSYRNRDWVKSNRGRRLDHIWCSNTLIEHVAKFEIKREMRSQEKPSDHVAVMVEINI